MYTFGASGAGDTALNEDAFIRIRIMVFVCVCGTRVCTDLAQAVPATQPLAPPRQPAAHQSFGNRLLSAFGKVGAAAGAVGGAAAAAAVAVAGEIGVGRRPPAPQLHATQLELAVTIPSKQVHVKLCFCVGCELTRFVWILVSQPCRSLTSVP
jgi:hypothetical protein